MGGPLFLTAFTLLWFPILRAFSAHWSLYEAYQYGWAVPALCAWLALRRRDDGRRTTDDGLGETPAKHAKYAKAELTEVKKRATGPALFFCVLMAGLATLVMTGTFVLQEASPLWRLPSYALATEGIGLTFALLYLLGGWARVRQFAFPVCFILVAVPWPTPVEGFIIQSLTRVNTAAVIEILSALGVPALAHGNLIELSTGMLGMDEACSGIRSTQAALMLSLFFGEFGRHTVRRRIGLVGLGLLIAAVLNVVRTTILALIAAHDSIAASAKWHDTTGVVVLLLCFTLIWLAGQRSEVRGQTSEGGTEEKIGDGRSEIGEARDQRLETRDERLGTDVRGQRAEGRSQKTEIRDQTAGLQSSVFSLQSLSSFRVFSVFRGQPFPPAGSLPLTLVFSLLSLVSCLAFSASELWFRVHEQRHAAEPELVLNLPTNHPSFRPVPFSDSVRGQLQFDTGTGAAWQNEDGTRWQIFHLRWNTAQSRSDRWRIQLAKSHRPEICLPSSGRKLEREYPATAVSVAGLEFPFRTYQFSETPSSISHLQSSQKLFVFFCVREDFTPAGVAANMRDTHWSRFDAAWNGNRGLGQRSIEVAIWGARDVEQATELFRKEVDSRWKIGDRGGGRRKTED